MEGSHSKGRQAGAEVTPSMIKAGVKKLRTKLGTERLIEDDPAIVAEVFCVMLGEGREPATKVGR